MPGIDGLFLWLRKKTIAELIKIAQFRHKKAFVLKIPLHPPFPKGDNKNHSHIFIRFSPTHFHDERKLECPTGNV